MFKPPSLLAIQVIPTATVFPLGSHGVYIRAEHVSLPPHAPDMLSVRNEQLTVGDFHPISLTALSATPTRTSEALTWSSDPLSSQPSLPCRADQIGISCLGDGSSLRRSAGLTNGFTTQARNARTR